MMEVQLEHEIFFGFAYVPGMFYLLKNLTVSIEIPKSEYLDSSSPLVV